MKYMLDTNICIYIIKKHPEKVLEKFKSIKAGEICMSSIPLSELMFGVQKSEHKQKNTIALQGFTSPLEIIAYDEKAAHHYGNMRAYLEKQGTPIGPMDLMIAAHAQSLKSILITHNTKEFHLIPNLKMEDWNS